MPALHSELTHNLESLAVRRGLDGLLEAVRNDYRGVVEDLVGDWRGDTLYVAFTAYGFRISAEVHVGQNVLEWNGYVPSSASIVQAKVQRTIETKLSDMLRRGTSRAA